MGSPESAGYLPNLQIAAPCSADWAQVAGNERQRFWRRLSEERFRAISNERGTFSRRLPSGVYTANTDFRLRAELQIGVVTMGGPLTA